MKKYKKRITIAVIVCIVLGAVGYWYSSRSSKSTTTSSSVEPVERGAIEVSVTGTGTIVPIVDQEIGADKSGTVKAVYVKNGDKVKKGDLLVQLVDDSLNSQLEKAKLDVEKARLSLSNTATELSSDTITAPFSGRIVSLSVKAGDDISNGGALATIQDDSQLVFDMPLNSAAAAKVALNQKVEVFLPTQGDTVEGRVISKNSVPVSGYNGLNRAYLKVAISATGNLAPDTQAFGSVTVSGQKVDALSVSTLEWKEQKQLKATLTGNVTGLYVQEGQTVRKGQKLFALASDTAANNLKTQKVAYEQAVVSLAETQKEVDDLSIKAPIDGFISGMDVEPGDEVWGKNSDSTTATTSGNGSLGKIINTSQMEITFPADEVDIDKVKTGQTADISVDAVEGQAIKGKVTEVSEEGEVTNNVGSFDVTILVDNSKRLLKSGMTANVTIVVAKKDNALIIPIDALHEQDGKRFVLVPSADPSSGRGRQMKSVTVGLMNEESAEITSGLQEGDQVVTTQSSSSSQSSQNRRRTMGGMPGMGGPPN